LLLGVNPILNAVLGWNDKNNNTCILYIHITNGFYTKKMTNIYFILQSSDFEYS
jgi:hypothetical protein